VTELTGIAAGARVHCPYCGTATTATGSGDVDDVVFQMMAEAEAAAPPRRGGVGRWMPRLVAWNLLLTTVAALIAVGPALPRQNRTKKVAAVPSVDRHDQDRLPPPNPYAAPYDLDEALQLLRSNDAPRREAAVDWLARAPVEEARRAEVCRALLPILESREWQLHHPASIALAVWGDAATADTLYRLAQREAVPGWGAALESLALRRDPRVASLAASYLPNFFKRAAASRALELCGSLAEEDVVLFAFAKDGSTRREALRLLGAIGTRKSLPALAKIQPADGDVADAIAAIQRRYP